jgi:hypothetical protein
MQSDCGRGSRAAVRGSRFVGRGSRFAGRKSRVAGRGSSPHTSVAGWGGGGGVGVGRRYDTVTRPFPNNPTQLFCPTGQKREF